MAMKMTAAEAAKLGLTEHKPAKKPKAQKKINPELFKAMAKAHGLTEPVPEYRFKYGRKWAADWMFAELRTLVEIEGGAWTQGRHTRGQGFEDDIEKYAEAICLGWFVLRVTPRMVEDGRLFNWLSRIKRSKITCQHTELMVIQEAKKQEPKHMLRGDP